MSNSSGNEDPQDMPSAPARKPFTGRHMTAIFVGFFGVVIAVNITMARLASGTFGGTVVDNSYVASQKYNGWLAQSRAQQQLGWATPLSLDAGRHVVIGVPGSGFSVSGTARHPLGRAPDIALAFARHGDTQLVSDAALPPGRWQVKLQVREGGSVKNLLETLA